MIGFTNQCLESIVINNKKGEFKNAANYIYLPQCHRDELWPS